MDDRILIAGIAAASSILGVLVSSGVSFFANRRSEKQKLKFSSAEYLRHKIEALERCREILLKEQSVSDEITKDSIANLMAEAVELGVRNGSSTIRRVAHYLPGTVAHPLLKEGESLILAITLSRISPHIGAEADPTKTLEAPAAREILTRALRFSESVAEVINLELAEAAKKIDEIYQLRK